MLDRELKEVKKQPEIDELSKQIVEMMDDRKAQPTSDRLYAYGMNKLRQKTIFENTRNS